MLSDFLTLTMRMINYPKQVNGLSRCRRCKGSGLIRWWVGVIELEKDFIRDTNICGVCRGRGVIDWVQNIRPATYERFFANTSRRNLKEWFQDLIRIVKYKQDGLSTLEYKRVLDEKKIKKKWFEKRTRK